MNWTKSTWIIELRQLYPNREDFAAWLNGKNDLLNQRTPIQALFDGDECEVVKVIEQLTSGAYV